MKKLISIFLLLFLFSCSFYEKEKKIENKEIEKLLNDDNFTKCIENNKYKSKVQKEVIKSCMNKNIIQNNSDSLSGTGFIINLDLKVGEIDFRKFTGDINKIIFPILYDIYIGDNNSEKLKIFLLNNKSESLRLYFTTYNENDFYILNNINFNNLEDLYLDLGGEYKLLDKTLKVLLEKLKNKGKGFNLSLGVDSYILPKEDEGILINMNISKLLLSGISPRIDYSDSNKGNIIKYKNDIKETDRKINSILSKSETLEEITIDEYKIFTKKDGKIEIEDIRMSK